MKEGRLHLRLDQKLVEDIKAYAQRHHVTVASLVERFLYKLLEHEKQREVDIEPGEQI